MRLLQHPLCARFRRKDIHENSNIEGGRVCGHRSAYGLDSACRGAIWRFKPSNSDSSYNERNNQTDYRQGYRAGYDDARANRRFNDRENDRNGRRGDNGDRSQLWQKRYSRAYTQADDSYYQQCRNAPDPAGMLVGALLGGMVGNTAASGRSQTGATVAGVIIGGALGASLTSNLDCEDRSYSHKAYYDGFRSGRPNQDYAWRNPKSGRHGVVRIGAYYDDPDGFRCTSFSQTIYVGNTAQEGRGRACQQPDGSWAIVS